MYLPTYLPACLPIYLSIESSFDPFIQPANQPTMSVYLSIYLPIYLSIYICVYTHQMISYAYVCSILCTWFFLQDIHVFSLQCKFTLFSSHNTWLHMFFVFAPFNRAAKQHVKRSMWGMSGEKSCSLLGQMFSLYLRNDTFYYQPQSCSFLFRGASMRFPHSQPSMCDCSCGSVRLMLQTRGTAGSTRNPSPADNVPAT